jgi:uncharacterized protein YaaW (UPF0174 family)
MDGESRLDIIRSVKTIKMRNKNYTIEIEETTPKQILKRSVDNIRFQAIKEKVNLESELFYNKQTIGSPLPRKEYQNYLQKLVQNYQQSKLVKLW